MTAGAKSDASGQDLPSQEHIGTDAPQPLCPLRTAAAPQRTCTRAAVVPATAAVHRGRFSRTRIATDPDRNAQSTLKRQSEPPFAIIIFQSGVFFMSFLYTVQLLSILQTRGFLFNLGAAPAAGMR